MRLSVAQQAADQETDHCGLHLSGRWLLGPVRRAAATIPKGRSPAGIAGLSGVVGRHGGYVEKFAGDALMALFGAPVSHEDDAARALRVAVEMHEELARLVDQLPHEAQLTLHIGVNSGHGIARILGSEARMDYAVRGNSVILAQRLESAAPPGETYVREMTVRLAESGFEFEPIGELTL